MSARVDFVRAVQLAVLGFAALRCGGESLTVGLDEPIAVSGAQFVEGELPGEPPLSAEEIEDGAEARTPRITSAGTVLANIRRGLADVAFAGFTTDDARAVAVALEGEGSGHWLFPAGFPDPANNGDLGWNLSLDIHESAPTGRQRLLVVAIDARGRAGTQSAVSFCIGSELPDNKNACDRTIAPPKLIVGLEWDTPVDLDLRVETPDNHLIASASPSTAVPDESDVVDVRAPGVGVLDFDSNKDCAIDGRQREYAIWQSSPPSGKYRVFADLGSACGELAAHYTLTTWASLPGEEPDTYRLKRVSTASGVALAAHANVDGNGTLVTEFIVP